MAQRCRKLERDVDTDAPADKERVNNLPVGHVTSEIDGHSGVRSHAHGPHRALQHYWPGRVEHTSFEVPMVSLHDHERIEQRTVVEAARKRDGNRRQTPRLDPRLRVLQHRNGQCRPDRTQDARLWLRWPQPISAPGLFSDGGCQGWLGRTGAEPQGRDCHGRAAACLGTVSLPYRRGEHRRVAVEVVDDRGVEAHKPVESE